VFNLMIDLETLSTSPLAAVTQIGAVAFDPYTGKVGEKFERHIGIESSIKYGMKIDGSTLCWWMGQSDAARRDFTAGQSKAVPVDQALTDLEAFVRRVFTYTGPAGVWSHGATFDLPILECASRKVLGRSVPWKYVAGRDTRTLFGLVDKKLTQLAGEPTGVAHNAVDDCIHQIAGVHAAMKLLGLAVSE
jgi:hypothetical protein